MRDIVQEQVFREYKPLLFSIAYHMLGSVMDAEDCVQEAFLQWYARDREEAIENPRAFLCTLVTRRSIDHLRAARVQRESYVGLWLPEPLVEADPSESLEQTESLSMAFLLLLERLSPIERAVFLLREVFDCDYAEIATLVGKSVENCRQVMHRARQRLPQRGTSSRLPREGQQRVLRQFMRACQDGDMQGLLSVLSEEVLVHTDGGGKTLAIRYPVHGPDKVARFMLAMQQKYRNSVTSVLFRAVWINSQPGIIGYLPGGVVLKGKQMLVDVGGWGDGVEGKNVPAFVLALTLDGDLIGEIDIVTNPEKLQHLER